MKLADVKSFGGTDADEDSLLLQSFEDHPSYIEMLKHEKFCIVGRKGSGKTAIFKKIFVITHPLFRRGNQDENRD
jgi:ABC-type multidrug transport system fused ATPase/permease subunit